MIEFGRGRAHHIAFAVTGVCSRKQPGASLTIDYSRNRIDQDLGFGRRDHENRRCLVRRIAHGGAQHQDKDAHANNHNRDCLTVHDLPRHALVIMELIGLVFLVCAPRGADYGAHTRACARVFKNSSAPPRRSPDRPCRGRRGNCRFPPIGGAAIMFGLCMGGRTEHRGHRRAGHW